MSESAKYDVFISYSRKDMGFAEDVCKALDSLGVNYFIDRAIHGGTDFTQVLADSIKGSEFFLFLASHNSYDSKFIRAEIVYAFNNLESGRIIPFIIDDSELPDELVFLFSNINWRKLKDCPPESLAVEIRNLLDNPTLSSRLSIRRRVAGFGIKQLSLIAVPLLAVVFFGIILMNVFVKGQLEKRKAMEARNVYQDLVVKVDSLIKRPDYLRENDSEFMTTKEQISCLKDAIHFLDSAAIIKMAFEESPYYASFGDISDRRRDVEEKLDSTFVVWRDLAEQSYDLYLVTKTASDRESVLECVSNALSVKDDERMKQLNTILIK